MRPFLTLHDPQVAKGYYEKGLWTSDTFYSLLAQNTQMKPGDCALQGRNKPLTWEVLKARVDAMADDLVATGLVPGDRVSLWMSNRIEAVITFLACSREGYACNPSLHKTYTDEEVVSLLSLLQASAFVTEQGWGGGADRNDFNAQLSVLPSLKKIYDVDQFPSHILSQNRVAWNNPDSVVYLAFTSGTTGTPKCVMHSSNTILANCRDLVSSWSIGENDVILSLSPLSHHIAWVAVGQWLIAGCRLVTNDPVDGLSQLDWIVDTHTTYVMGVPTHAMDILAAQKAQNVTRLGDVRIFYMAGAPIPALIAESFVEQGITPQNIYGMTENGSHQYTWPNDDREIWVSTCGRGGPGYEVRIFDPEDDDRELSPGETGQIGGRGADLMLGYYDNQQATAASFNRDGWFLSGDLGSLDEDGNLSIVGRLKDLIIRGGHNIYPSRIEALALTNDAVEKAAAFGVPDDRLGEKVCLVVLGRIEAEEMLDHLAAEGLSVYDMPEWFVCVDELPLTASGKILKRELSAMIQAGELVPAAVRFEKNGNGKKSSNER